MEVLPLLGNNLGACPHVGVIYSMGGFSFHSQNGNNALKKKKF